MPIRPASSALLLCWLGLPSCLQLGCGSDPIASPHPGVPAGLHIVSPVDGAEWSGLQSLVTSHAPASPLARMWVQMDERTPMPVEPPRSLTLVPTANYANGLHRIRVGVETQAGERLEDSVEVQIDNPEFRLLEFQGPPSGARSGQELRIGLTYSRSDLELAADLSAIDARFSEAALRLRNLGAGRYELRYPVSARNSIPSGRHLLALTATSPEGQSKLDYLPIELRTLPPLPFTVLEGVFVDAPFPLSPALGDKQASAPPAPSAPTLRSVESGAPLITGSQLPLDVAWRAAPGNPVEKLLVGAEGFAGYFVVPVSEASVDATTLTLAALSPLDEATDGTLPLELGVVGVDGNASRAAAEPIATIQLPEAGVSVTLTWDTAADLDLTLYTPFGNPIDFARPANDGGRLALDANSACQSSTSSAENISWGARDQRLGQHQVFVNLNDGCGAGATNWTLTAQYCGHTDVMRGTLTDADRRAGEDGSLVLDFEVDCQRISGRIERQSIFDSSLFFEPARFVTVRALPSGGGLPLQTAFTDAQGNYDLLIPNPELKDVEIEVEASWVDPNSAALRVDVSAPDAQSPYLIRLPDVISPLDQADATLDLTIDAAMGAGAFNVLDVIRRVYGWAMAELPRGTTLPAQHARWELDDPEDNARDANDDPFTHYDPASGEVIIGSSPRQQDDFDASIIGHEFMHFVIESLGYVGPTGGHAFKSNPRVALFEGAATALSQTALGSREYISLGDFWLLEDLEIPFAVRAPLPDPSLLPPEFRDVEPVEQERLGTRDGTVSGDVSEWLVAMILWDMMDGVDMTLEPHDLLDQRVAGVGHALCNYLHADPPPDRGAAGRDLVDVLDGFREHYGPAIGGLATFLTAERQFPYTAP